MSARFYFYDHATGEEITGHPFSGCAPGGMGEMVSHPENGKGWTCYRKAYRAKNDTPITVADFPGHEAVRVKCWFAEKSSWFVLVA